MMRTYHKLTCEQVCHQPCVLTFGTFDGVHRGHQYIFEQVKKCAQLHQLATACLTFSNHPSHILHPEGLRPQLTTHAHKIRLLEAIGFDILLDIPFDQQLCQLSASDFLSLVRKMLPFTYILVGSDVSFGNKREGNRFFLEQFMQREHGHAQFFERFCVDQIPVSSSRIRSLILEGSLSQASTLLGRPYSLYTKYKGDLTDIQLDVEGLVLVPDGVYHGQMQFEECTQKEAILIYSEKAGMRVHRLQPVQIANSTYTEVWIKGMGEL